jgi:hypothetical protein
VPVTIATVTGENVASADEGSAWLAATLRDRERATGVVLSATAVVNRALAALRAAAGDPLVQEIGASRALAIRLGHGTGDELVEGSWTEAKQLPGRRWGRLDGVDPQSRIAAVLAGRDQVHPAETLLLRARLDAEQGRPAEARYGLRAARAAIEGEPTDREAELRAQLEELERRLDSASGS